MRTQELLAFVFGICLTVWACALVMEAQQARIYSNFQRDADKVASDTGVRLQIYFDMLLSLKGAFAIHERIDRAQFVKFVHELKLTERYPGFQAIQFVRLVPARQLEGFAASVRRDTTLDPAGYPGFAIHPNIARDEHFIIEYTEPLKGNENAFGLDLAALAPHLAAIEEGRDTGQVVATERIALVQDAAGQPGFVARAPVYRPNMPLTSVAERRAALVGLVAIVFRVNKLMREVIDPSLVKQLSFQIHDGGNRRDGALQPAGPGNLMFDSSGSARALPGLAADKRINVAQRQWVMHFKALQGGRYSRDVSSVVIIGAAGIVISALIAALMIESSRSRDLAGQLRVTLDEQHAFQDSASVGIALFSDGLIMRCNRGMEEIMGYSPGELAGRSMRILSAHARGGGEAFAVDPQTRRWQSERELVRKDGSSIWCLINGKALDAADLSKGGVWVIQDISDRKRTEAALVDAKDGLEHSLIELEQQKANAESAHSDLSAVLATLQQAQTNLLTSEKMASLGSLVAGIAHELNTPIGNSLLTATSLAGMVNEFEVHYKNGGVRRSVLEAHLADTKLACGIMAGSLQRAADLVTSFKQVAVDQTSDKRRRFNMDEVVHDTLTTYAAQLRRASCEIALELPPLLPLDSYPGGVGQVLANLLNNALLHAFEGRSSGSITISASEEGEDQVRFVFADDGVGMPPKILRQVFDPFFTTRMGQGGSGLGMNIVYNIVTGMLGGSIAIESTPEQGTRVSILMPRSAPGGDAEQPEMRLLKGPYGIVGHPGEGA